MASEELLQSIKEAKKGNAFLFGSNREVRRLPEYLHENEHVYKIISGTPIDGRGRGIVVATNERILFIKDGWIFRTNQDFPYETLSTVEFRTGLFFGRFTVFGKGDETGFHGVGRFAGAAFTKKVRELSAAAKRGHDNLPAGRPAATSTPTTTPATKEATIAQQIRDIEALYRDGIITLNEFEIKKQELLSRL